jgi:UDP-N-acetylglucosamine 4,6-dehydratase
LLEKKNKLNNIVNITHKDMTRFFISKIDSVKFVNHCVKLMKGGEIFVPKLPSMNIYEMAKIICRKAKFQFIGLRPGEKLHEVMCPDSNSDQTVEFKNFYCIKPTAYTESRKKINYNILKSGEKGKKVNFGFNYNSKNNCNFLQGKKLNDFLKRNRLV